jgi:pilus assembly protein FimV
LAKIPPATQPSPLGTRGRLPPPVITRLCGAIVLGAGCLLAAGQAAALTLGDLVVQSRPGEPLRASIPLTLDEGEQLAQVHITLASAEVYQQQHLERPPFLDGLRTGLFTKGDASAQVKLFGEQPWQGGEAVLLLQAAWPQGQTFQRFHLAGISPDKPATPLFVEVAENETLDAIAIRLSKGSNRSYLHMMYALFLANPEAFYRGNMNNLKGGARLRVPTEDELYRLSDAEVFGGIRRQFEQWQQQRDQAAVATTRAGEMLSGMSDAQAAALKLGSDPAALQRQLEQLAGENEAIQRRNAELKARLARLEQQMRQISKQVLEYPTTAEKTEPVSPPPTTTAAPEKEAATGEQKSAALPTYILFLTMVLALGAGVAVWRVAQARQGRAG